MRKPNVLLLTVDTLRRDALRSFGNLQAISPNIDLLTQQGIQFDQAITGGSWTQAAFPVLLTSSYASMYGGCLGPLSPQRPRPFDLFRSNGYNTAGFSTSPLLSRAYGYDRGFDLFEDLTPNEKDPFLRKIKGGERLLRQPIFHSLLLLAGVNLRPSPVYVSAEHIVDRMLAWLEDVESPFFGWAHFMDIHWPYHREKTLTSPKEISQAWQDLGHLHRVNWHGAQISPEQEVRYRHLYQEAVTYADAQIGRLFDRLGSLMLWDKTVIVLVSDHGEEFLEHGRWGHFENNLYDEILRVPLVIRIPHLEATVRVPHQVSLIDLMPTIFDICELDIPTGMYGKSWLPLLPEAQPDQEPGYALSEMWRDGWHIIAVRTERYKYIWDNRGTKRAVLYDLKADPQETLDCSESLPETVRYFQGIVDRHLADVQQTTPDSDSEPPVHDEDIIARLRDLGYFE